MVEPEKKKILVADDEPAVRELVRRILNKNYTVLEAQNGEVAVSIARSQNPDIILMDMMMPVMDGLTACNAIKSDHTTRAIPAIMVTAIGFELNIKLCKQMGASDYLIKPFTSKDLLDKIEQFLSLNVLNAVSEAT